MIGDEALRFQFLAQSESLSETEQLQYQALIRIDEKGIYTMPDELLMKSLLLLSRFLQKHYGKKVILLMDEYDVPLDKAYQSGYYEAMADFIGSLFGQVLKTNRSIYFAVLTGCLRISKESIFTGLNNFSVYTVRDVRYQEYFGFTDGEVRKMLEYYGCMEQYGAVKEWYDGYRFGGLRIYCPWDVMKYCDDLRDKNAAEPQNYWVNTSSNNIIRRFMEKADKTARDEIEQLINGGTVKKEIREELTYRDLDSDVSNLWSILFTAGYLTQHGTAHQGITELVIPNREIRWIFVKQIREWFETETRRDVKKLESFCRAFEKNDAETGDGYSDISIEIEDKEIGIIIELKYAEKAAFEDGCKAALQQIRDRNYEEVLIDHGMKTIYRYGIACYKKRCKVRSDKPDKIG